MIAVAKIPDAASVVSCSQKVKKTAMAASIDATQYTNATTPGIRYKTETIIPTANAKTTLAMICQK